MSSPYTLTLHETKHPDRPLTFTLDGDFFSMDLSAAFAPTPPEPGAPPKEPIELWAEKFALKAIQPFSGPTHVRDVLFSVQGEQLVLQVWKRAGGLRLAPATIALSHIDNPLAAADFALKLEQRAAEAAHPGKYAGPLDYWGSWVMLALGAASAAYSLYRLLCPRRSAHDRS